MIGYTVEIISKLPTRRDERRLSYACTSHFEPATRCWQCWRLLWDAVMVSGETDCRRNFVLMSWSRFLNSTASAICCYDFVSMLHVPAYSRSHEHRVAPKHFEAELPTRISAFCPIDRRGLVLIYYWLVRWPKKVCWTVFSNFCKCMRISINQW